MFGVGRRGEGAGGFPTSPKGQYHEGEEMPPPRRWQGADGAVGPRASGRARAEQGGEEEGLSGCPRVSGR